MSDKLWFISEGKVLIRVFDALEIAQEEIFFLKEDEPDYSYRLYSIEMDKLKDFKDEFAMAVYEGYAYEED